MQGGRQHEGARALKIQCCFWSVSPWFASFLCARVAFLTRVFLFLTRPPWAFPTRGSTDDIRSGLIAQSVKASLERHWIPTHPIIGSKMGSADPGDLETPPSPPEELMTLSYDRLVPLLLGSIKELTNRVQQLESLIA